MELALVHGTSWKEMILEEFGNGIMSAIDYDTGKGDRVRITMSGKFLPYKRY